MLRRTVRDMRSLIIFCGIFVSFSPTIIQGHGHLDGSRAHYGLNWANDGLFCGGFNVQWNRSKPANWGKCGICGDSYYDKMPRRHELGGNDGKPYEIKGNYIGRQIPVNFEITAIHGGYVYFELCNLDVHLTETEKCFENNILLFEHNLSDKYYITDVWPTRYKATLLLPNDTECKHCVLRWTYYTSNTLNYCDDANTVADYGCGPQETFKNCMDISISSRKPTPCEAITEDVSEVDKKIKKNEE